VTLRKWRGSNWSDRSPVMTPEKNALNEPAIRRVRLRVGYHGGAFRGFALNDGVETVEGVLTAAIEKITRAHIVMSTAGRTDAGVHGRGQYITFDMPTTVTLRRLVHSINGMCGPHIVVSDATWVDADFDARESAVWRQYKYLVWSSPIAHPMLTDRAWHVREPLNLALMNLACDGLIGEQDFTAFCRKADPVEGVPVLSLHRFVMEARWSQTEENLFTFDIRANAYCHQMVRSIVGFLVDVGLGKRPASDTRAVLYARDRAHGSMVAPPQGLTLWDVGYEGIRFHTPNRHTFAVADKASSPLSL